MKKYNIVFFGTPAFALPSLRALYENHNLIGIVSQPDRINKRGRTVSYSPVKEFALENDIDLFQPENINSKKSLEALSNLNIDFIVVVAYGQIIGEQVRNLPKEKIINVHASLLPKYRGAAPIHRAIMAREEYTGVSIMEVGPGLDEGDVFYKLTTEVAEKNLAQLHDELADLGSSAIIKYLDLYSKDQIERQVQDDSKATYADKVSKEDGYLRFESVDKVLGQILGLYPRPGASFDYKEESVKALNGSIVSREKTESQPGDILQVDEKGILVACQDGQILIDTIQFPGKSKMKVEDYIRGNEIEKNENLRKG